MKQPLLSAETIRAISICPVCGAARGETCQIGPFGQSAKSVVLESHLPRIARAKKILTVPLDLEQLIL